MASPMRVLSAAMILAACSAPVALGQSDPAKPQPSTATSPKPVEQPPITLHVGDKAPALSIEKWVKGEQVTGFEKGRTYIVEFWATWCGPCIASMPHLSAIQKQYKDSVQIVGVTKEDANNSLVQVEKFVNDKGDGMGYTVAWDQNKETYEAYMKAAGRNGIPCSFVVDGAGTIAYIGHPMWLDIPLERITKGTWDHVKGMEEVGAAEAKLRSVSTSSAKDPKAALAELRALEKEHPAVGEVMSSMKFSLLAREGSPESAKECRDLVAAASAKKDGTKLGSMARALTATNVEKPDLDLALTAATKAVELTGEKNPSMLDALARVHFLKGDKAAAVEWQTKAIAVAPEPRKKAMEKTLAEYKGESK